MPNLLLPVSLFMSMPMQISDAYSAKSDILFTCFYVQNVAQQIPVGTMKYFRLLVECRSTVSTYILVLFEWTIVWCSLSLETIPQKSTSFAIPSAGGVTLLLCGKLCISIPFCRYKELVYWERIMNKSFM